MEPVKRLGRLSGKRSIYSIQVYRILVQILKLGLEQLRAGLEAWCICCVVAKKFGKLCPKYLQKHRTYVTIANTIRADRLKLLTNRVNISRNRLLIEVDIICRSCSKLSSVNSNTCSIISDQPDAVRP